MLSLLTVEELVAQVVVMARSQTPRDSVELGVLQGFCVDVATDLSPDLVLFMSSANGLERLVSVLNSMPDVILPATCDNALWNFVRDEDSNSRSMSGISS